MTRHAESASSSAASSSTVGSAPHAAERARSVTFAPARGCLVTLVDLAVDGFLLGAGTMVDESSLKVVGLERQVGYQEAKRVLAMDDDARAAWYAANPAVTSALHFKITASDNSISGHIGTSYVVKEGDHNLVAQRVSECLDGVADLISALCRAQQQQRRRELGEHLCCLSAVDTGLCQLILKVGEHDSEH